MIISMRVTIVGAGLMGAQIGCEYALGGHEATLVARNLDRARERVEEALSMAARVGLASEDEVVAAQARVRFTTDPGEGGCDLAVESLPEDLELKAGLLQKVATGSPDAILASNTSSLSISDLGEAVGAGERTIGTHYWNPPLLSPLVETIPGARTDRRVVECVVRILEAVGKRPVLVEREVPGFIWNRLQMALLRESVWLVEAGVASPETVDEVVRSGLARRWRHVGPFQAIALGGIETWERAAANLLPELSTATSLIRLRRFVPMEPDALKERRDRALAEELIQERRAE
jgi:3-hydroxybutyryl-CoA dehydrogenase